MNKYIIYLLLAFTLLLINSTDARNFNKRKYYKFKRGNNKALFKPQSFRKTNSIVSNKKDSSLNQIIKEEIKCEQLPLTTNTLQPIRKQKPKQSQLIPKRIEVLNIKLNNEIQPTACKKEIKVNSPQKDNVKGILYYILSGILSICLIAGLVIGIIWLANLSLLGLIAAILISVLIVFYVIIAIAFSKGVN